MYDVSDTKALRRVYKTLWGWGKPVQYSVFRVRCSARELERMRFELARIMDPDDRLLIARLCDECAGRVTVRGKDRVPFDLDVPPFKSV